MRTLPRLALATLALAPLLLAAPPGARANMADPVQAGTPVGEPAEALAGLVVERERLVLDLRPLAEAGGLAVVEATYRVRNDGAARTVPLAFIPVALADDEAAVWVDDRPVPVARDSAAPPPAWASPAATPRIDGGAPLEYRAETYRPGALRFDAPLPTGVHTLRVRYHAAAGTHDTGDPTTNHQLGYVLAPARRWAGFGGLDVEVRVPAGWDAAASLPLTRDGDVLAGAFDTLPADALAVTVRAPAPWGIWPLRLLGLGLALALCLVVGRGLGRWLGRRGRGLGWAVPLALLAGVAAGVGAAVAFVASYGLGDGNAYGYGGFFVGAFAVFPLVALGGTAAALVTAARARRASAAPAVHARPPLPPLRSAG